MPMRDPVLPDRMDADILADSSAFERAAAPGEHPGVPDRQILFDGEQGDELDAWSRFVIGCVENPRPLV
ncbi:MAG: hypothetical protein D6729_07860 [Deltaproteobacteria bacterium]|nr:MAG: hypothetical protein D6729_07860 [Deltaproteobacteria bacterium]